MTRRAVFAVVVQARGDAQRGQGSFVKTDGPCNIAHGQKDMIQHGKILRYSDGVAAGNFEGLGIDPGALL